MKHPHHAGVGKSSFWGILNSSFKHLLDIISPVVGWCEKHNGTFTNPHQAWSQCGNSRTIHHGGSLNGGILNVLLTGDGITWNIGQWWNWEILGWLAWKRPLSLWICRFNMEILQCDMFCINPCFEYLRTLFLVLTVFVVCCCVFLKKATTAWWLLVCLFLIMFRFTLMETIQNSPR